MTVCKLAIRPSVERLEDRCVLSVSVDLTATIQPIYGFGAGMKRQTTELMNMQEPYRSQVLNLMFNDVNTRILRTYLKSDQYATPDTGPADVLDLSTMDFRSYGPDVWVLQQAQAIGGGKIDTFYASSNTGPAWMKTNGSVVNGTLLPDKYDYYGKMIWGYLEYMHNMGLDVQAVSMFNEPGGPTVYYDAMQPPPDQAAAIFGTVGDYLHAHLPADSVPVPWLVGPDTVGVAGANTYLTSLLGDSAAAANLDVVSSHYYAGTGADWARLSARGGGRAIWETEWADSNNADTSIANGLELAGKISDVFANGGNAFVYFQWAQTTTTPGTGGGLIIIQPNGYTLPKRYFVFKQFANTTPSDSYLLSVAGAPAGLQITAYLWPDGHTASIQVVNDTTAAVPNLTFDVPGLYGPVQRYRTNAALNDARLLNLQPNGETFRDTIPAQSFMTYVIDAGPPPVAAPAGGGFVVWATGSVPAAPPAESASGADRAASGPTPTVDAAVRVVGTASTESASRPAERISESPAEAAVTRAALDGIGPDWAFGRGLD